MAGFGAKSTYPSEVFLNCLENMTSYSCDPNSVDDIVFELLKDMLGNPIPLCQQITPELLYRFIEQYPRASLQQLCEQVMLELRVSLSITSMSRLLRQQGLTCKARRQLVFSTNNSLLRKAA